MPAYKFALSCNNKVTVLNIEKDFYHENDDPLLSSISTLECKKFNNLINFKETKKYLDTEKKLCPDSFLNESNIRFFYSKMEQDRIFKVLDIPTVPNQSKNIIVKTDYSGGEGFKILKRSQLKNNNNFVQDYLEIDYIISSHFYARKGTWYWLNNHIMKYNNNCPLMSLTTPDLQKENIDIISDSVEKLKDLIYIDNKLFGWQFLIDKKNNIYSIDFNLRPFGGFDKGSYDTDVSNQNWVSYLYGGHVPNNIVYSHQVKCKYNQKTKFGYEHCYREKIKSNLNFKVIVYE